MELAHFIKKKKKNVCRHGRVLVECTVLYCSGTDCRMGNNGIVFFTLFLTALALNAYFIAVLMYDLDPRNPLND